ncbi:MAG: hypothetical protein AAF934_12935, partial [Bacteroidota bacterium]
VAFSQDFIVSLDFFGSFFYQEKNEQAKNQYITKICYVELRLLYKGLIQNNVTIAAYNYLF